MPLCERFQGMGFKPKGSKRRFMPLRGLASISNTCHSSVVGMGSVARQLLPQSCQGQPLPTKFVVRPPLAQGPQGTQPQGHPGRLAPCCSGWPCQRQRAPLTRSSWLPMAQQDHSPELQGHSLGPTARPSVCFRWRGNPWLPISGLWVSCVPSNPKEGSTPAPVPTLVAPGPHACAPGTFSHPSSRHVY